MRISDWSSDVCAADLAGPVGRDADFTSIAAFFKVPLDRFHNDLVCLDYPPRVFNRLWCLGAGVVRHHCVKGVSSPRVPRSQSVDSAQERWRDIQVVRLLHPLLGNMYARHIGFGGVDTIILQRSEEQKYELQSLIRSSYAAF